MNRKELTEKQRYWLSHIEACQAAEQTLASYANTHDLDVQSLYRWKSVLTKRGCFNDGTGAHTDNALFTRVTLEPSLCASSATWQVHFPNGCVLHTDDGNEAALGLLIQAVLSAS